MAEVIRSELLAAIEGVKPAVDAKNKIPQGDCVVFRDGKIYAFRSEVACVADSPLDVEGAVNADLLVAAINKLGGEQIEVSANDSELILKSGRRKAGITFQQSIDLPIDSIVYPDQWEPIDESFLRGLSMTTGCCGVNLSRFILNCINFSGNYISAADPYQIIRCKISYNFVNPILVNGRVARNVLDAQELGETTDWLHFRKASGLIVSCRKYLDEFPEVSTFFEMQGDPLKLPQEIGEIAKRAEVFAERGSEDFVPIFVSLKDGTMMVEGRSTAAWYKETADVEYIGPKLRFSVDPNLLSQLIRFGDTCLVSKDRLLIRSDEFEYVTCLGVTE